MAALKSVQKNCQVSGPGPLRSPRVPSTRVQRAPPESPPFAHTSPRQREGSPRMQPSSPCRHHLAGAELEELLPERYASRGLVGHLQEGATLARPPCAHPAPSSPFVNVIYKLEGPTLMLHGPSPPFQPIASRFESRMFGTSDAISGPRHQNGSLLAPRGAL